STIHHPPSTILHPPSSILHPPSSILHPPSLAATKTVHCTGGLTPPRSPSIPCSQPAPCTSCRPPVKLPCSTLRGCPVSSPARFEAPGRQTIIHIQRKRCVVYGFYEASHEAQRKGPQQAQGGQGQAASQVPFLHQGRLSPPGLCRLQGPAD